MTTATDIRAFLRAIADAPDDDTPRLVFADWLDDHGRPDRAEFIRVEVEIARTRPGDPARSALFARRHELFQAHAADWFRWFSVKGVSWATERGFVTQLVCTAEAFLAYAGNWFATQPITRLTLDDVWIGHGPTRRCVARELFASDHLGQLTHLALERVGVNSAGVYWLSRNPGLVRLRDLTLRDNNITDDGAKTLARMPGVASLESLDLVGNRITDAGAGFLIASPHLGNLRELRLSRNPIGDGAWAELEARFGDALMG